ncbi:VOC family protein [Phascolarctobacterium succinatutens]|uniref:VOC family protein n=1 Tax=Phascolarctobacterium succinatutens TaxID=626940 RepID=UPI002666344C|nr:VOC family protein [Phascolarctobacterium succinatutens]
MEFTFAHNNFNVLDLEKSLKFYEEALGLKDDHRKVAEDGSFILVYLTDGKTPHLLELTWLRDRKEAYNLGENEFHLAFFVDDYEAAHAKHKEMGCICYENPAMGIYFITDPDNYWLEIVPKNK